MLELHYATGSVAIAVAIALEESGLNYTATRVDFASREQTKPAYLALNPKGRVPALITDHGVMTETGAILEYIGAQSDLIPVDPVAATRMREVMYYIASTMHVAHAHKLRGARWANLDASFDDMRGKVTSNMAGCCSYLEHTYAFDPFALGAELTAADPYLFIALTWAKSDGVDLAAFPKLTAFMNMMHERASVQAIIAKGIFA